MPVMDVPGAETGFPQIGKVWPSHVGGYLQKKWGEISFLASPNQLTAFSPHLAQTGSVVATAHGGQPRCNPDVSLLPTSSPARVLWSLREVVSPVHSICPSPVGDAPQHLPRSRLKICMQTPQTRFLHRPKFYSRQKHFDLKYRCG